MAVGKKIPRDEVSRRMQFVEDGLAALMPLEHLYAAFREAFGVGQRCAEKYVRRVHERWAAEPAPQREQTRRDIARAADVVFRQALARRDHRAAVSALELKGKLDGLLTQKIEHSGSLTIDPDALFRELQARRARPGRGADAGGAGGAPALPAGADRDAEG